MIEIAEIRCCLALACDWLCDTAQVRTTSLTVEKDCMDHGYTNWLGAIRGEYSVARREWSFFCPVWHTGQAVKALLMAARVAGVEKYREAAQRGVEFILDKQVWQPCCPEHGLILAFEDMPRSVCTSAVLECMDGLLLWADERRDAALGARMAKTGEFLIEHLYMPDEGLFRDVYDIESHGPLIPNPYRTRRDVGGRPLLDDAIWSKLHARTGNRRFLDVQVKVSETLLATQNPAGNWGEYGPCGGADGPYHPRHTYWWGMPLLATYRDTGRREFLDTARASGEFTLRALRRDGGCIRNTYRDPATGCLTTDSFGHATSGSACAAIFFLALFCETGAPQWREAAERALSFCMTMQLTDPADANLKGVIVEKVLPPDGTDRSPYHIRDLGTIFFVQAAAGYVQLFG